MRATSSSQAELKRIIDRCTLHAPVYAGAGERDWRRRILNELKATDAVLDVGKSSRDLHSEIKTVASRTDTLDVNRFDGYPDIVLDLCAPTPERLRSTYDVVVCFSVLEALHDPAAGVAALYAMLKPHGRLYLFAPFIGKYEAPRDRAYHDFFRFTRDGLAFLLREFEQVDIYPVRGQYSAAANLLPNWKTWLERRLGHGLNRWMDGFADPDISSLNASGYFVRAVKTAACASADLPPPTHRPD